MAKTKKPAAKKAAPKKKPGTTAKARPVKAAAKSPRAAVLPGMEQVRNATLDNLCANIADDRAAQNELRQRIDGDIQAALDEMVSGKVKTYHHAGVELAVVPGSYKLRVRTHKEATANEPAPAGGDTDESDEDA